MGIIKQRQIESTFSNLYHIWKFSKSKQQPGVSNIVDMSNDQVMNCS